MAILRLSTGEVVVGLSEINEIIAPAKIGSFDLTDTVQKKVQQAISPLTRKGGDFIIEALGEKYSTLMKEEGLTYRRVATYIPPREKDGDCAFVTLFDGELEANVSNMKGGALSAYLTPHKIHANDQHFCFASSMIKGMQLKGDLQAILYITAGEWMRMGPTILNWPIFPRGETVIGLSFFDRPPKEGGMWEIDLYPDHPVLDCMRY